MGDMIRVSDYIILDTKESKLSNAKHKNECRRVMEAHRGVEYLDKDRKHVSPKTFAGYILRYRINLFRLDSSERYIKNQIRHNYEQVSDVTLRKICMNIMDELDNRGRIQRKDHCVQPGQFCIWQQHSKHGAAESGVGGQWG